MAAKGKPFCQAQRNLQGLDTILKSAACEWVLIFLMLIDALLSYVMAKFAYICKLQPPCILCSRLDHLLGEGKNNYRNLLCSNHKMEISSLISCCKHDKLVNGGEMCDGCLCSFATNSNSKFNSEMQRLLVGKLRSDTCENGSQSQVMCSCCSKPWRSRPNAQELLQLKPSVKAATKPNIPLPRRLTTRRNLKKVRVKSSGSDTLSNHGKTGFDLLSHMGYTELKIASDSESEVLLSQDDDEDDNDDSLICERSALQEDSLLQHRTKLSLKPDHSNRDPVKPSANFFDSRPSLLESYVQVDTQKHHHIKSLASDAASFYGLNELNWIPPVQTAISSPLPELISLDDPPASNSIGLLHGKSVEKRKLTYSLSHDSTFSSLPELINLDGGPQSGQHSEKEPDLVIKDLKQFPVQNTSVEKRNSSSNDEGQSNSSDLQEIQVLKKSVSVESDIKSLDGSNASEIEGENVVDKLKRQVEYDRKCISSLYKELDEERRSSEVAANQAMAMITRLTEEKAAVHMEALQYLRMMEEQAEYDVEALEKANELLTEKEKELQDLEAELEFYRGSYLDDSVIEVEHEKNHDVNEENVTEDDSGRWRKYKATYSFTSTFVEMSKGSNISLNLESSPTKFEDRKIYIQLCLKSLEDKINKISATKLLAILPNSIEVENLNNGEKEEENTDAEGSQRSREKNGLSMDVDEHVCNGTVAAEEELVDSDNKDHQEENVYNLKGQISCGNNREVDFLSLEQKISDLAGRLEAAQAGYDFLEHSLNSFHYGEEGLQFIQDIAFQLQELCKLGIRLDRESGS